MGVIPWNKVRSAVLNAYYSVQSNPLTEAFAGLCWIFEPLILLVAAAVIVNFFYRVCRSYRLYHPNMIQRTNVANLLITAIPSAIPFILIAPGLQFSKDYTANWKFSQAICGFTGVVCVSSWAYPMVVQSADGLLGNFFPMVFFFSAMLSKSWYFVWFFALSIPCAFVKFGNEKRTIDTIRRNLLFPFLLLAFLGIATSKKDKPRVVNMAGGMIGALLSLIFSNSTRD